MRNIINVKMDENGRYYADAFSLIVNDYDLPTITEHVKLLYSWGYKDYTLITLNRCNCFNLGGLMINLDLLINFIKVDKNRIYERKGVIYFLTCFSELKNVVQLLEYGHINIIEYEDIIQSIEHLYNVIVRKDGLNNVVVFNK